MARQLPASREWQQPWSAVLVVARVGGDKTQAGTPEPRARSQQMVVNGTPKEHAAAQGLSGVVLGLKYVETGVTSRFFAADSHSD